MSPPVTFHLLRTICGFKRRHKHVSQVARSQIDKPHPSTNAVLICERDEPFHLIGGVPNFWSNLSVAVLSPNLPIQSPAVNVSMSTIPTEPESMPCWAIQNSKGWPYKHLSQQELEEMLRNLKDKRKYTVCTSSLLICEPLTYVAVEHGPLLSERFLQLWWP